ncbi:O-methyltransferase, putative [Talaromyces stipitatus ATCC 10500]|uniref:O-methyltransferase, putative n=1 Tax=Talaromyces stipitatus (strain ATCC 10500 / CBS 375.48 / QM 6759 / NRRL 1006) TaxID=441959 RepID=B8MJV7_TALSN|nr:O-methyltransferase, putative [Talaromyces stipitatus ATCC 10500]EED14774.1 O-methyltransferase, putative [Talaromyces stipitatus ATCC 10500]
MDTIVAQIKEVVGNADVNVRAEMLDILEDLVVELRDPMDILYGAYGSAVKMPMTKVCADIGVFKKLAELEPGASKTVDQLAGETGADAELLERVLRYLSSIKYIQEIGPNQYTANKITHILANPVLEASLTHGVSSMNPAINATPAFLKETGYKNVNDSSNTPFQKAFNTKLKAFDYMSQVPEMFNSLQIVMSALESSNWTKNFDIFQQELNALMTSAFPDSSKRQFLVDVGGGHGHQCVQLLQKYPILHGKLTLEDLPEAVEKASRKDGVSYIAQDFFKPQAIQGAKFYYMRRIMHDWPEDECVQILRQLVDVLAEDSRILLDEVLLPDTGAHWQATMADLSMMIVFAGAERTSRAWHRLVAKAGLRIAHLHTYDTKRGYSVIVLEKAS